jgi:hypothetical protein
VLVRRYIVVKEVYSFSPWNARMTASNYNPSCGRALKSSDVSHITLPYGAVRSPDPRANPLSHNARLQYDVYAKPPQQNKGSTFHT